MFHNRKINPDATPMTLATTMSTTRQRKLREIGAADREGDAVSDAETPMMAPPCAGMTQIRFDGRSVDRFLSARLTGLPWLCR
ncbi:hypothetical protein GCM10009776_18620 [Microbacterium deminutum]|uniref:Uncharacterized protein n=1 Tax=Microbacterium deminutum TaxID=344164 RepID=A0ABN2QR48_9MICO